MAENDDKYKGLIETMTRIQKQLSAQQIALSGLVMKVNNLIERKTKKEKERNATGGNIKVDGHVFAANSHLTGFSRGSRKSRASKKSRKSKRPGSKAGKKKV